MKRFKLSEVQAISTRRGTPRRRPELSPNRTGSGEIAELMEILDDEGAQVVVRRNWPRWPRTSPSRVARR